MADPGDSQATLWIARAHDWLTAPAADFVLARALFLRVLGLVYVIAFASFAVQARGLVGGDGIVPAARWLQAAAAERDGVLGLMFELPTVFWFGASDGALVAVSVIGAVLGGLVVLGVAPRWCLLGAWALYLSVVNVGMPFMAYQWDMLLLEVGLLAVLLAPGGLWPEFGGRALPPPRWAVVLFWFLFFKLMVLSGLVKLLSGDPTWRDFTALQFHYWTQPLPTPLAWWADRLPGPLQRASAALMFAIEIGVPFLFVAGARGRRMAAAGLASLQILIAATGNYGFFNLLTAALAILLVDDEIWRRVFPRRLITRLRRSEAKPSRWNPWRREAGLAVALGLSAISLVEIAASLWPKPLPPAAQGLAQLVAPLRSVNGYGLFAVMTTTRPEIVIEGTRDGRTWTPYTFKWKPGEVTRTPGFVAPYQPRLDWQMWFAALGGDCRAPGNRWYLAFLQRLLEAKPEVLALLEGDPFPGERPSQLRSTLYQYRFATPDQRARTGATWTRQKDRPFCPTVALREGQLVPAEEVPRR